MKPLFCTLILLYSLIIDPCKAQESCGTEEEVNWNIEANYNQSKQRQRSLFLKGGFLRSDISIPIQFHVLRPSSGISDFNPLTIDTTLNLLNEHFGPTPFSFYQCGEINYIDDDRFEVIEYGADNDAFYNFYNSKNAINIYLPRGISSSPVFPVGGFAFLPWTDNHAYVVPYSKFNNVIHVHEMGHLLGLYHTHQSGELVDGSNCMIKGDLCCDTPAEPDLKSLVDSDCNYTGDEVDPEKNLYMPDVGNYMSYARRDCRTFFTQDQIDRMLFFYQTYMAKFRCDDDFEYTDVSYTEITTIPYPAVEGEPYYISAKSKNLGNVRGKNIWFYAYLGSVELGKKKVNTLYNYIENKVGYEDKGNFPTDPGRYEICIETEGDSLEINPLNNRFCQEILIRQKEGIADVAISELGTIAPKGEQNVFNEIGFQLENLGSVEAQNVSGNIYVDDIPKGQFFIDNLEVGEMRREIVEVPFGRQRNYDVCIEINPAFAEERLDNNDACAKIWADSTLWCDMVLDSFFIESVDSLLTRGEEYSLKFRFSNIGDGIAYLNKAFLKINGEVYDSLIYQENWGFTPLFNWLDSITFTTPINETEIDICMEMGTYKDEDLSNNEKCQTYFFEVLSNTEEETLGIPKNIEIYPNPFEGEINISSTKVIESVKLMNALGEQIYLPPTLADKKTTLNLSNVSEGVYFLHIKVEHGTMVKKVLKVW